MFNPKVRKVILIFAVLFLLVSMAYAYTRIKQVAKSNVTNKTVASQSTLINTEEKNQEWQTFKDSEFGFEFNTPAWISVTKNRPEHQPNSTYFWLNDMDGGVVWIRVDSIDNFIDFFGQQDVYDRLMLLNNDFDAYPPSQVRQVGGNFPDDPIRTFIEEKIETGGKPALNILTTSIDPGRSVYILANNHIFEIYHGARYLEVKTLEKRNNVGPTFDKILQTFNFIN